MRNVDSSNPRHQAKLFLDQLAEEKFGRSRPDRGSFGMGAVNLANGPLAAYRTSRAANPDGSNQITAGDDRANHVSMGSIESEL